MIGMKYVTLCGMSKSGNHALVRWMTSHWEEAGYRVFFRNNVERRFLEHLAFVMESRDREDKKVFIVSLEDRHAAVDRGLSELTATADHNVLIVRDPLNLFASRLAGLRPPSGLKFDPEDDERARSVLSSTVRRAMQAQIDNYTNHWREYSGESNLLSNKVCVCYNYWVTDPSYRRSLIEESFGLAFTDSSYSVKAGSSFGRPDWSPVDYMNRWRHFWDDRVFQPVRENGRLLEIARLLGVEPS